MTDQHNKIIHIQKEIEALKAALAEKESALPIHSVRAHQIQAIEDLEDQIEAKKKILSEFTG